MERQKLKVEIREEKGKEKVKKLRLTGDVPGVVYKKGATTMNVKVNQRELFKVLHTRAGENVLLDLEITDNGKSKKKTVIIKEIQHHPIKDQILHVDFNEILLTEAIKVNIPIIGKGEPEGVVKDGGTLEYVLREAEIECLPTQIPEGIEVHVETLKIGDSIYIKDLVVPSGIKILNDPELVVMSVEPPYEEKPAEEEGAEAITEPELIRKEKKEGEEEEAPEAEAKEKPAKEKPAKEPKKEEKKEKK